MGFSEFYGLIKFLSCYFFIVFFKFFISFNYRKYPAYFQTTDFIALRDQLKILDKDLNSSFEFSTLEDQLTMKVSGDGVGHVVLDCVAQDQAGNGNILEFTIETDQTILQPLINQIDLINKEFPKL